VAINGGVADGQNGTNSGNGGDGGFAIGPGRPAVQMDRKAISQ